MIGPLIRYLRILAGLSHYDLARMSNATVSQTHVAEADRSNDPELILALLYTLGIDPDPAVIDTVCALADRDDPRYLGWMPATLDLATVHGPLRDIETVEHTLGEPIISENAALLGSSSSPIRSGGGTTRGGLMRWRTTWPRPTAPPTRP